MTGCSAFLLLKSETDLELDLEMANRTTFDMAPGFDNFEPLHISHGFTGLFDGSADRFLDRIRRTSDQFDGLVNVVRHCPFSIPL